MPAADCTWPCIICTLLLRGRASLGDEASAVHYTLMHDYIVLTLQLYIMAFHFDMLAVVALSAL